MYIKRAYRGKSPPYVFDGTFHRQMISASFAPLFSGEHRVRFIERSLHVSNRHEVACAQPRTNWRVITRRWNREARRIFLGTMLRPAIIAIHRGTIPRNAFQSPVRRREKHFRRPEITRLNWFSLRCGNTRPDRAVVVRIKTSIILSPPPSTGGRDHQSGSVYLNAWNRTSREYEDNIRAFSGKPWQRNGRVHRLWRELDKPVCGGGLDSSEHGGQRQPFPQATRASITITIVCCLQHLKFTTAWVHKQFQGLFEGFNYLEESWR